MFPALRSTAWLWCRPLAARFHQTAPIPPFPPQQQTLADFIQQGHFWRHLKKMRASYSQRRAVAESALQAQGFQVTPQLGGIQLVMSVSGDDRLLARAGGRAGGRRCADWRIATRARGIIDEFSLIRSPAMADGSPDGREAIAICGA